MAGVATISLPSECELPPAPVARRSSRAKKSLEPDGVTSLDLPMTTVSIIEDAKVATKQNNKKRKSTEVAAVDVPPVPVVIEGNVSLLPSALCEEPEAKKVCCQMDLSRTLPRKTMDPINCSDIIDRMYNIYYALEVNDESINVLLLHVSNFSFVINMIRHNIRHSRIFKTKRILMPR